MVSTVAGQFYDDKGNFKDFISPSKENLLDKIIKREKPPSQSQEKMEEECRQIKDNVSQGKSENIEIRLDKHIQLYMGQITDLGMTIIKFGFFDISLPSCIFYRYDDKLKARVYIGGDNAWGYLVTKDENGAECFTRLRDFHMLSTPPNPDPRKDLGMITSYTWLNAKVYTSKIYSYDLIPLQNLILSEWLQSQWQQAKDAREKSLNDNEGEDNNG